MGWETMTSVNVKTKFNKTFQPKKVSIVGNKVQVKLANGRVVTTSLKKHSWLANATPEQQNNYLLGASSILWPDLDDGLDIEWMLTQRENRQKAEAAQTTHPRPTFHIVPRGNQWVAKAKDKQNVFSSKEEAIEAARQEAHDRNVIVHGRDGRIEKHLKKPTGSR
jgi:hypothetical protein